MYKIYLLIFFLILGCNQANNTNNKSIKLSSAINLELVTQIGNPVADRMAAWNGHVNFLVWLDSNTIVFAGESGFVNCYNLRTKTIVWRKILEMKIKKLVAGEKSLYLFADGKSNLINNTLVCILNASNGDFIHKMDCDNLAILTENSFFLPTDIVWLPNKKNLIITAKSSMKENSAYMLDSVASKLFGKFEVDYYLTKILPSPNDLHILTLSHPDNICIWDLKKSQEIFRLGKKVEDNSIRSFSIDTPFISNAVFNGKETLIYSIDNSWATGTIHIFDIKQNRDLAQFDSRNGHLCMDVDFQKNRIALTGTSIDVAVVDFKGNTLAELKKAALQRITLIQFSPDGKHLAIGGWDNTVKIFNLKSKD